VPAAEHAPALPSVAATSAARGWTLAEALTGGLSLIVLIFLDRPWYDISVVGCPGSGAACSPVPGPIVKPLPVHAYLSIAPPLILAIVIVTAVRAGRRTGWSAFGDYWQVLAGISGVVLLLILIAFLNKPGISVAPNLAHYPTLGRQAQLGTARWTNSAYIALAAAAGAAGTATVSAVTQTRSSRQPIPQR